MSAPERLSVPEIVQQLEATEQPLLFFEMRTETTGELRGYSVTAVGPTAVELKATLLRMIEYLKTDEHYQKLLTEHKEKRIIVPTIVPPNAKL